MKNKLPARMKTGATAVLVPAAMACRTTAAETPTPGPGSPWQTELVRDDAGGRAFSVTFPPGWDVRTGEGRELPNPGAGNRP